MMQRKILITLISLAVFVIAVELSGIPGRSDNSGLDIKSGTGLNKTCQNSNQEGIIKVPEEISTIEKAVKAAKAGDRIILSPGTYFEKNIVINKAVTISSEWKLSGDESIIDKTIIDSDDKILFSIEADGVEISGLKIINGDHTLNISANVTIMHNHFIQNHDGVSFESSGGGYVGYNIMENDGDDGIDLDIRSGEDDHGSNILVEHNTIINSNDDGIEIRLFTYPDQNINYIIRENTIIGSKNAGIQLISYDEFTGKVFQIHHNIIRGCKTGLGCMEGSNTREDLSGASKMDELVSFFNNSLIDNQMGATGGNNIIAFNNVVMGNTLGGFKRFGSKSAIINNLFYMNGGEDFIEINESAARSGNIFSTDPLLDKNTFTPAANSPCIDAGKVKYELNDLLPGVPAKYISGTAPDIGAIEFNANNKITNQKQDLIVDAGEDLVLVSPSNELLLQGKLSNGSELSFNPYWKLERGPGKIDIINPDKIQTKVLFHQEGIYQFSFVCSDENQIASDYLTVRYINDGNGKELFLKDKIKNIIEAEEYSYSYGDVSVIKNPESSENMYVEMKEGNDGQKTFIEYSVGNAENEVIIMWLLLKNQNTDKSSIQIKFNNQEYDKFSVSKSNKWKWMKVPGNISVAAGQWPVLVRNVEGSFLIDKIMFSFDPKFTPKRLK